MEDIFSTYTPIDNARWVSGEKAREGINLKQLKILSPLEEKIWDAAIPFQDQRDDPGQGELVTYFGIQLLKYIEGKREVVVPACILHDTGWYGTNSQEWKDAVKKGNTEGEAIRRPHQNRGIIIAGNILGSINYPIKKQYEIADIIGDHDTRISPAKTNSERIMRSADLLWRVTVPNIKIYTPHLKPEELINYIEKTALEINKPEFSLKGPEKDIARIETANSLLYIFGEKAKIALRGFEKEIEYVTNKQ